MRRKDGLMVKYRNRWSENKLYCKKEKNTLYDIVYLYGAYIKYVQEINEGAFIAYFNKVKGDERHSFINAANKRAREYFDNIFISSRKMLKLVITSNKKVAVSYDWMPEYVDFILSECLKVEELKEYIVDYILKPCDKCINKADVDVYIYKCVRKILGFQYILLDNISSFENRRKEGAKECIEKIEKNSNLHTLIEVCPNTVL